MVEIEKPEKPPKFLSQMTFLKMFSALQTIIGQSFTLLPLRTIHMKKVLTTKG